MTSVPRPEGLTDEEAVFAEALSAGASQSEAGRATGKPEATARMWASRAARRPRVRAYLAMLRAAAAGHAISQQAVVIPAIPVVPANYHAVADASDVMMKLTRFLHADIGSVIEEYDDPTMVDGDGAPLRRATLSLVKAVRAGVTDLIDEIHIGKDGSIRIKFVKKMEVVNALIGVLGMKEASESDRVKERAAVADALAKLPPEALELLATYSLGPSRMSGNGTGQPS